MWHDGIEGGKDTMGHGSRRAFFDCLMKAMMKTKGTKFRDWHRRAIPPTFQNLQTFTTLHLSRSQPLLSSLIAELPHAKITISKNENCAG